MMFMKSRISLFSRLLAISLILAFFVSFITINSKTVHAASSVKNKVFVGYQGWFFAPGDTSPVNAWKHWSGGTAPSPGNQTFEMYPDSREYASGSVFQTGYANLGNGQPAKLFSSYPTDVVNKHFSWMQSYGIDGAALQRFGGELANASSKAARDSITVKVKNAAEQYGKAFYIEYDISGMAESNYDQLLKDDWTKTMLNQLNITASTAYAKEAGKPVVEIWGLGFPDRPGSDVNKATNLVNWFKSQGVYVIGGVPRGWRNNDGDHRTGYTGVYDAFDMISPWMVGYTAYVANPAAYVQNFLVPDRDYLTARGKDYQPVLWSGFAWSNWNGLSRNYIPRKGGDFLWKQAVDLKLNNIHQGFIAMFDEYDEGTAIAKFAEDSSMIPTNQYFLTTSADGKYLSSDFYLRLAGKVTSMVAGTDPLVTTVPIPASLGPVFFRTGLETDTDAFLTWVNTISSNGGSSNVTGYGGTGSPGLQIALNETSQNGTAALRVQGRDNSATSSFAYFDAFQVNIPITSTTQLKYGFQPKDANARYTSIDLVMTDGSTLRASGATDQNGISMNPNTPRGTANTWSQVTSNIGGWLNGKTISKILVGYGQAGGTGDFRAYFDNIEIANSQSGTLVFTTGLESGQTQPTWIDTVDWSLNITGYCCGLTKMESSPRNENPHSGASVLMYSGSDSNATTSYSYNKVFDVNIPITASTTLSYWIRPEQANGRFVAIDFVFTDGTNLHSSSVVDQWGDSIHPGGQGNGTHLPINTWSQVTANVGIASLVGKTIDRILVAYDQGPNTGGYRGLIDDITITN